MPSFYSKMAVTEREKQLIKKLKKLGGSSVPVKISGDLGRVSIGGKGFSKITKHVSQNTTITAREIILARKKLIKRRLV